MEKGKPTPKEEVLKQRSFLGNDGQVDQSLVNQVRSQDILNSLKPLSEEEKQRQEDADERIKDRAAQHSP